MITRQELIKKYLDFFKSKEHKVIPNSSLIPANDPTVLFTTAGMHPLVPYLLGEKHPLGKRVTNVQRCIRTTDIDAVGDPFHHTFFEMLGNWSFGDYWKKEAIEWSYEFLTSKKWLGLDKDKITVSCFAGDRDAPRDDESANIWKSLGVKQIKFLGKEDNWWGPAGETGPCGPDTEMFVDGVEIWNDVFMQYNKTKIKAILIDAIGCLFDEKRKVNEELLEIIKKYDLKKIIVTNIEKKDQKNQRILEVIKGNNIDLFTLEGNPKKTDSNFFKKLLDKYQLMPEEVIYFDHSEDNLSSAKEAGITKTHLYKNNKQTKGFIDNNLYYFRPLQQKNVDTGMGVERTVAVLNGLDDNYLIEVWKPIIKRIEEISGKKYEGNEKAMRIIADHIKAAVFIIADGVLPSNTAQGYVLRRLIRRAIRFYRELGQQITAKMSVTQEVAKTIFDIYEEDYRELRQNKKLVMDELKKEEEKFIKTLENGLKIIRSIIDKKNKITAKDAFLLYQSYGFPIELTREIAKERGIEINIKEFEEYLTEHRNLSRLSSAGIFKSGLADHSEKTTRLHTATHLLNEALRRVLGPEVRQRGSNITPERLRFDFNFPRKLTNEEISRVEKLVNEKINEGLTVKREEMPLSKALKSGAQAEFGSKYPDVVSVYTIGDFSKEICTGPHVKNTKEVGKFKIIKEEASAAGIRRIKAIVE